MNITLHTLIAGSPKEILYVDVKGNLVASEEGLSTIDGFMINPLEKVAALKKGAGVMVGDFFVGVTTGSDIRFSNPDIVY
jgi:hypothetical protein